MNQPLQINSELLQAAIAFDQEANIEPIVETALHRRCASLIESRH